VRLESVLGKSTAEKRKQRAGGRKQKANSRELRAESREQRGEGLLDVVKLNVRHKLRICHLEKGYKN
jgi:hypothetical protein